MIGRTTFSGVSPFAEKKRGFLFPIAALWGIVLLVIMGLITNSLSMDITSAQRYYLLPWALLTGIVVLVPAAYLLYCGEFDPCHPMVFVVWSYFLPAFCVGGILLALGIVDEQHLTFVDNQKYNLPLTFIYIIIGFAGIAVGFAAPLGRFVGQKISKRLPTWQWSDEQVWKPALMLFGLGMLTTFWGFIEGLFGFQRSDQRESYDGAVYLLTLLWSEACFVLWLLIWRARPLKTGHYAILAGLLVTLVTRAAFAGSRGALWGTLIMILFAYILAGRKITLKSAAISGTAAVVLIIAGVIYGTTFREVKGDEARMDIGSYAQLVPATFEKVSEDDVLTNLGMAFDTLGNRMESVGVLSVVVANYEKLAPEEKSYGIDNNIWYSTAYFLVPRILWPDKPVAFEPHGYSDLYFNYRESSFLITPIGDLLRNFGPVGVPLGMIFLGLLLRTLYTALVAEQPFSYWRATMYYMIFSSLSLEGAFGFIVPTFFNVGFTALVGLLLFRLILGKGTKAGEASA